MSYAQCQFGLSCRPNQIERILDASPSDRTTPEAKSRLDRVKSASEKIAQIAGTQENPTVQKWQGLITLAEGQKDKAIRQLYKTYEQSKALDQPNQTSQVDSYLCYILAGEMAQQNVFGMQKEFLEKAIFNRSSIAAWRPEAILDYAKILIQSRSLPQAAMIGATKPKDLLLTPTITAPDIYRSRTSAGSRKPDIQDGSGRQRNGAVSAGAGQPSSQQIVRSHQCRRRSGQNEFELSCFLCMKPNSNLFSIAGGESVLWILLPQNSVSGGYRKPGGQTRQLVHASGKSRTGFPFFKTVGTTG